MRYKEGNSKIDIYILFVFLVDCGNLLFIYWVMISLGIILEGFSRMYVCNLNIWMEGDLIIMC